MTIKRTLKLLVFTFFLGISYGQEYISETIEHKGLTREYSIYIPADYDGTTSVPILFNFHGGNGVIASWQKTADMRSIADTANFILVYPQARQDPSDGNSLNWLPKTPGTFDDVPFISALIDTIASSYLIDQNRIYACGYSLGGEFSYELACKLNSRIAAIGAVARTMQGNPDSYCTPTLPIGVLTILGTDDFISPYDGLIFGGIEFYISAAETHSYWAAHNNCGPTATFSTVSPSVERYRWSTAAGCTYVEELKVLGGGHDWPGSFGNMTIDASTEIWQFVSKFDINGLIGCATTSSTDVNRKQDNFLVYPNPVTAQLTIKMERDVGQDYRIYSTFGELVSSGILTSNINTIDLSSLAPNVYHLKMGNHSIRLMKIE